MYSGGRWNPDLEEPYLLKYSEFEPEMFRQCTTQIFLRLVNISDFDTSPVSYYSESARITKFSLLGFSGMKS